MYKDVFLGILGMAAGVGVAGGVFTSLLAVGLVPRFAGKTHTGDKIFLYEEMVVLGTITGNIISIYGEQIRNYLYGSGKVLSQWMQNMQLTLLGIHGIFSGIFVGCLAMAIAEMLDTIPIFSRRVGFRHGLGIAVTFMAAGKVLGSLLYFAYRFFDR